MYHRVTPPTLAETSPLAKTVPTNLSRESNREDITFRCSIQGDELWKIIDQGITFGAYHQSERTYYEGLKSWAAGDSTAARRQLLWLAQNNWYFDEGVVAAALLHSSDLRTAYRILSEALQVNPRSIRILKAYIPVALGRGFDQYAADALETLGGLLPPAAFRQYVNENQFSGLLLQ